MVSLGTSVASVAGIWNGYITNKGMGLIIAAGERARMGVRVGCVTCVWWVGWDVGSISISFGRFGRVPLDMFIGVKQSM